MLIAALILYMYIIQYVYLIMLQEDMRDNSPLQLSLGTNLRFLKLEKCMSLVKLFPPSLLQNLEELIVENCDNLEQLFDL